MLELAFCLALFLVPCLCLPTLEDLVIPSRCEYNPGGLLPHEPDHCDRYTTEAECQLHKNKCWWRDTTIQNTLATHSVQDFQPHGVQLVYSAPDGKLNVYIYSSYDITNVIAIVGAQSYVIMGCGGSNQGAKNARNAFLDPVNGIPGFATKTIDKIILSHSHIDHLWGCPYWLGFGDNGTLPLAHPKLVASEAYKTTLPLQQKVQDSLFPRAETMFGMYLDQWGPNDFLGEGIGYSWKTFRPQRYFNPYTYITTTTNITTIDKNIITLIPSPGETDDQMIAYLPAYKVLFPGDNIYNALANVYTIRGTVARLITKWVTSIDAMINLKAQVLVPEHSNPIVGTWLVNFTLTQYRDALTYIHDTTVRRVNAAFYNSKTSSNIFPFSAPLEHITDIANSITLPAEFTSPYIRQMYGYIPFIVQSVFEYYFGWYSGEIQDLEKLNTADEAARLIGMVGPVAALTHAKEAITEGTREGWLWALKLTTALRKAAPSADANIIYAQALRMLGYTTPSATARNWYLTVAKYVTTPATRAATKRDAYLDPMTVEVAMDGLSIQAYSASTPPAGAPAKYDVYVHFTGIMEGEQADWTIHVRPHVVAPHPGIPADVTPVTIDFVEFLCATYMHTAPATAFPAPMPDFFALFAQ